MDKDNPGTLLVHGTRGERFEEVMALIYSANLSSSGNTSRTVNLVSSVRPQPGIAEIPVL